MVALCQVVRVSLRVSRLTLHPLMYARRLWSLPALNGQDRRCWGLSRIGVVPEKGLGAYDLGRTR